jgi:hypothetical protein
LSCNGVEGGAIFGVEDTVNGKKEGWVVCALPSEVSGAEAAETTGGLDGVSKLKLNAGAEELLTSDAFGTMSANSDGAVEGGAALSALAKSKEVKLLFDVCGTDRGTLELARVCSGESGSAVMDAKASGEEARGRVLNRLNGPLERAGTGGPKRSAKEVVEIVTGAFEFDEDSEEVGLGTTGGAPRSPKLNVPNRSGAGGRRILSSSSISGKSSSLAEKRPLGVTFAAPSCTLRLMLLLARRLVLRPSSPSVIGA